MRRDHNRYLAFCLAFVVTLSPLTLQAESAPSSPSLQPSSTLSGPSQSSAAAPQAVAPAQDILHHEPLLMEGVGIYQKHAIDFGVEMAIDGFHPEGVDSDDFNITYLRLLGSLGYRFAPISRVQLSVSAPFMFQLFTYGGTSGVLLEDDSSSGLGQVSFGAKVPFTKNFGAHAFMELPTGNPDKTPALGEGMNLGAMLLAEAQNGPVGFHAGVGQIVKSEYDQDPTGGTTVKRDPGDVTALTLALTTQSRPRSRAGRFGGSRSTQVGGVIELHHYTVGEEKSGGATVADSDGAATNLLLGVTIGSQTEATSTVAKIGFAFGVGDESHQSFDVFRGAGDFSYFGKVSTRWGGVK